MKVCIAMDMDGHFRVANISDREKVIEVLESCEDGDYLESELDNLSTYEQELWQNYKIVSNDAWENLLCNFEQRGTFEISEI